MAPIDCYKCDVKGPGFYCKHTFFYKLTANKPVTLGQECLCSVTDGTVWERFAGVPLFQEVCHWAGLGGV